MRRLMLAGILALGMMGSNVAFAGEALVVTAGHLAQFRATLNLTADQQRYWAPIAAAFHDLARRQNAPAVTLDAISMKRLVVAAMPLFRRLDSEQKRDAMALARSLGISSLARAF